MVFAHDAEVALQAAVTLVNTGRPPDTLTSQAELDAFYDSFQYTGARTRDDAELEAVRGLRPRLRELLTSGRDDAVALVNRMLAEHHAVPRLVAHDRWDYHLHATDEAAPLADRIVVETAMAMVDVIRADKLSRLSVCADASCDNLVLDLSRNHSRRFCSALCGNRAAVAAYRSRRKG
jgi:predicted RNA-binding Zn ribbon-like protein